MLLTRVLTTIALLLVPEGPGLAPADLLLLLEIGVPEKEIARYAEAIGGFQPLDADQLAAVEGTRPSTAFVRTLPRAVPEFGVISDLARTCDVYRDEESGVGFVHPSEWIVTRTAVEEGGTTFRVAPRPGGEPRVFVSPCIFVFVQERSGLVPDAIEPVLARIRQGVARKLRTSGLRPSTVASGSVRLLGHSRPTFGVEATIDGATGGILEIALDVNARGRVAGVGFTASAADRAYVEEAFTRLAASLVVDARGD